MKILAKSLATTTAVMTLAVCSLHNAHSQSINAEGARHFSSAGEIQSVYNATEEPTTQPFLFAMPQTGVIVPAFVIEMSLVNPPDEGFQTRLPGRSRVAVSDDIPLYDSFQIPESITSSLQIEGTMNRLAFQQESDEQTAEKKNDEKKKKKKPVVVRRGRKILNLAITRSGWRKKDKKEEDKDEEKEDAVPTPPADEEESRDEERQVPSIPVIPPAEPPTTD